MAESKSRGKTKGKKAARSPRGGADVAPSADSVPTTAPTTPSAAATPTATAATTTARPGWLERNGLGVIAAILSGVLLGFSQPVVIESLGDEPIDSSGLTGLLALVGFVPVL